MNPTDPTLDEKVTARLSTAELRSLDRLVRTRKREGQRRTTRSTVLRESLLALFRFQGVEVK